MPWKVNGVMDQRIEFVARAVSQEKTVSELCQEYGISRPTGYYWIGRYREEKSFAGLREKSRRPHHSPRRTPGYVEQQVLQKRVAHGWGARKLLPLLEAEGVEVSERTINRILKRRGAQRKEDCHRPALSRFERERPHEELQMQVPAQRYEPSRKHYQTQPRSWDYEDTVQVRLVGASGNVPWQGKAYFVSNALSGKCVGVEPVEDKLLVRYQQMYLCEIDLRTDRVTSFLKPVKDSNRVERNQ